MKARKKVMSRPALAGGLLGLAGVVGLAVLLAVNREPGEGSWGFVAVAIFAAPYGVAIVGAFAERAAARATLLLAAAITSLFLTAFLFALGAAFLPATVLLFIGAVRAMTQAGWTVAGGFARAMAALAGAALPVVALFALYTNDNERCWETVRYPDGSEETRSTERFGGGVVGPLGVPVETSRGTGTAVSGGCTSDVVTAREGARGLILTSAGVIFLLSMATLGRRSPSSSGAVAPGVGQP
jgi:hypothetical protein